MAEAALARLEEARAQGGSDHAEAYDDLARYYRRQLARLDEGGDGSSDGADPNFYRQFVELSRELLKIERRTAVDLRNQGRIGDELLRELQQELDLGELRLQVRSR